MTTTPEQRAEWKALHKAWSDADTALCSAIEAAGGDVDRVPYDLFNTEHDARSGMCDASRTALPALISHVEALEAENARLKNAINISMGDVLLCAGEMTAQEQRSVKAVLRLIRARAAMGESE